MVGRREFMALGAGTALGMSAMAHSQEETAPRIRRYATLGRTGLKVSDISFGSASTSDAALVRHAFERGVNFFDTAESYHGGFAEEAIGEALQGRRDKVVLSSKTRAGARETRAGMMRALERSLKRLGTDYLDIYFNHAVDDVERMQNEEWWAFTELAKKQGKIRFRGMSGHGSDLVECLDYVIDKDLADVILVAYNFAQDPSFTDRLRHTFHWAAIQSDLPPRLKKAREKGIGVLAMKTLMGARLNDMRPYERPGSTFSNAAFRWVLSGGYADALLVSMTSKAEVDEYLRASGDAAVRQGDVQLLERYAQMQASSYCQSGCNACAGSCPEDVAIAEVLRTRMYAVDYGRPELARSEYAALGAPAAACLACAHQSCLGACPARIPIASFTREAAQRLG
ncbi:MAG: aldo/keto reductase [Burkholderiales bacterium]|nr:aldo/keto reductase [Burkholderiales bacterium]